jgi:hypothetical protein
MSNQYASSVIKQQIHEMIEKQRDLLTSLEAIDSKLEEEDHSVEELRASWLRSAANKTSS